MDNNTNKSFKDFISRSVWAFFLAHYLCLPLYSGFSITKLPFHPSGLGFQEGSDDSDLIKRLQLQGLISVLQRVRIEQSLVIAMLSPIAHLL